MRKDLTDQEYNSGTLLFILENEQNLTKGKRPREATPLGIRSIIETSVKQKKYSSDENGSTVSPSLCVTGSQIYKDREGQSYQNKFAWPLKFVNSEARLNSTKSEPESVAELGKKNIRTNLWPSNRKKRGKEK